MTELLEYVDTYGEAMGLALYEQEYECSFDAAILGAYYGSEFASIDKYGRICSVEWDQQYPVHCALDIGYDDDTAIWFFQVIGGEIHVLDYYFNSGMNVDDYCSVILGIDVSIDVVRDKINVEYGEENEHFYHRGWKVASINLPHDAKAKTLAAMGKSVEEQFAAVFGWGTVHIVPNLSISDGIKAARKALGRCFFDYRCEPGLECLRSYHRKWHDEKKMFMDKPEHDWSSHGADSFRYLSVVWEEGKLPDDVKPVKWAQDRTFDQLRKHVRRRRIANE